MRLPAGLVALSLLGLGLPIPAAPSICFAASAIEFITREVGVLHTAHVVVEDEEAVFVTTDGGESWRYSHGRHAGAGGQRLSIAADGAFWRIGGDARGESLNAISTSTDRGASWTPTPARPGEPLPRGPKPPSFAVATGVGPGLVCAAELGAQPVGTVLRLVSPFEPQSWIEARVVEPQSRACQRLDDHLLTAPYAKLQLVGRSLERDLTGPFIAVAGAATLVAKRGVVRASSDETQSSIRFRVCTSREGFHLTAWAGEPLLGDRLWHRYFYVGYEAVPTCSAADYDP